MSAESNGHIEVTVGSKKTTLRKCHTKVEVESLLALLVELQSASDSYETLNSQLKKERDDSQTSPDKRVKCLNAIADLDQSIATRGSSLAGRVLPKLHERVVGGTPVTEYGFQELFELLAGYINAQKQTEEERKN